MEVMKKKQCMITLVSQLMAALYPRFSQTQSNEKGIQASLFCSFEILYVQFRADTSQEIEAAQNSFE